MKQSRRVGAIAICALAFGWTSQANASVARVKESAYAPISGSLEDCYAQALVYARDESLKKVASKVVKGVSDDRIEELLDEAEDAVTGVKVLSEKDMGDGRCRVNIRVMVDEDELAAVYRGLTTDSVASKNITLGAMMRFLVEGKPSAESVDDAQIAISKLGGSLREYGIQVVSLDPLVDKYARQEALDYDQVALAEGEEPRKPKSVSSSKAIRQLVETIERLWDRHPDGLVKFDALAVGQVYVRPLGRDPQGPGYLAEATTYLRVLGLSGGRDNQKELVSVVVPGTIDGQTQESANIEAMLLSVEKSVSEIAAALDQ